MWCLPALLHQLSCHLWEGAAGDKLGSICCGFPAERRDITCHPEYQSHIHTTQHTPNRMFLGAISQHALRPDPSLTYLDLVQAF